MRRRHPKTMLNQSIFPGIISIMHSTNLRHSHVRFINKKNKIIRQIIHQSRRPLARRLSAQITRIILNPRAISSLQHNLNIIFRTRLYPLRLNVFANRPQLLISNV